VASVPQETRRPVPAIQSAACCPDDRSWDALVAATPSADPYYRPGYVRAYEAAGHGRAVALIVPARNSQFLLPLLLRPVAEVPFLSECPDFDAITPYGYGGILRLCGTETITIDLMGELLQNIREWCIANNVVSIMLRLHPLLQQASWFLGDFEDVSLRTTSTTIALDTNDWDPAKHLITSMHRNRRSDLIFARRYLKLRWTSEDKAIHEHLTIFRDLYEERMDELRARDFYHLPPEYYSQLMDGLAGDADIAIAWLNDEPVGAAIFIAGRDFAHYHLSATNNAGRAYKASTFLLNAAAGWAQSRGCRWLHIGGGVSPNDQLFQFKCRFGGVQLQYSFVTMILNRERYDRLVEIHNTAPHLHSPRPDFFPLYRA